MKITWLYAALLLVAVPAAVYGQAAAVGDCSVTATSSAATAIAFPRSGGTGNVVPQSYLEICDSHATQTLGVNWSGGTAVIGGAGTVTLDPTKGTPACIRWSSLRDGFVPYAISVIASGSGTTTTCAYR